MLLKNSFASLAVALSASGLVNAWFRVACSTPIVRERVDPIINPGVISQHVHALHGGNHIGRSSTFDTMRTSTCTSCQVKEDLSAYWTPQLYFKDPTTGKFEAVPNGGLLVYYQNRGDGDVANGGKGLKAFPAGFRMITGRPQARTKQYVEGQGSQGELRERAVKWSCLRYSAGFAGYDGYGFPTTDCESGLNARLHMPACWDGVNLDSADHLSHTAYLSIIDNGSCPSTHPVYLMKLFYEITWDLSSFKSRWDGVHWPFVYANSDPTGYGWHGDFLNGWDVTALQNSIDFCNSSAEQKDGKTEYCPYLTVLGADIANACKISPETTEDVTGPLTKLPGCNPLQYGPADATLYPETACPV